MNREVDLTEYPRGVTNAFLVIPIEPIWKINGVLTNVDPHARQMKTWY